MAQVPPPAKTSPCTPFHDLPGVYNFAQIAPGLYRGAQPTVEGFATLQSLGIRTVINLRAYHTDRLRARGLGFNYVHLFWRAWLPRDRQIAMFLQLARDSAHHPVFVHCLHGADRTGVAIAAYRVVVEGWAVADAAAELRAFGHHLFFPQIRRYLRSLTAERLVQSLQAAQPHVRLIR